MDKNQAKKSGPQITAHTAAIFERALDAGEMPASSSARTRQERASSMNPESGSQ
ncbi:hypothetical protein [Herbaspirillum rhizosphaerae]|uniref:hypothetical protein n=1 Tax=Herbaspirillum rhizosphaerae TaxID=346179 RepID=UPI000AC6A85D|nr:hypothetical protein [Herbaspirillum rhizosphaerae]